MSSILPQTIQLPNEHLQHLDSDFLFHLEIPLDDPQVLSTFQNVKFVCIGGTSGRMKKLAQHLAKEINYKTTESSPFDYCFQNERYSGFKVGPIFCVSHGIGMSSASVMLHEVFKLLAKAQCCDVTLVRIGTCGGIGISPGNVVISTGALTAGFQAVYRTSALGKSLKLSTVADQDLVNDLYNCKREVDAFQVILGKTYCAEDFYQGQGRLDGSFCDYGKADQDEFLKRLYDNGVRNMEMESAAVLAMANQVGVKAAVVCSVLVNRLEFDRPRLTKEETEIAQNNSILLVSRYIKKKLNN